MALCGGGTWWVSTLFYLWLFGASSIQAAAPPTIWVNVKRSLVNAGAISFGGAYSKTLAQYSDSTSRVPQDDDSYRSISGGGGGGGDGVDKEGQSGQKALEIGGTFDFHRHKYLPDTLFIRSLQKCSFSFKKLGFLRFQQSTSSVPPSPPPAPPAWPSPFSLRWLQLEPTTIPSSSTSSSSSSVKTDRSTKKHLQHNGDGAMVASGNLISFLRIDIAARTVQLLCQLPLKFNFRCKPMAVESTLMCSVSASPPFSSSIATATTATSFSSSSSSIALSSSSTSLPSSPSSPPSSSSSSSSSSPYEVAGDIYVERCFSNTTSASIGIKLRDFMPVFKVTHRVDPETVILPSLNLLTGDMTYRYLRATRGGATMDVSVLPGRAIKLDWHDPALHGGWHAAVFGVWGHPKLTSVSLTRTWRITADL